MFGIRRVGMAPNQRLYQLTCAREMRSVGTRVGGWPALTSTGCVADDIVVSQRRNVQTAPRKAAKGGKPPRGVGAERKNLLTSAAPVLHNVVRSRALLTPQGTGMQAEPQQPLAGRSAMTRETSEVACYVATPLSAPTRHPTEAVIVTVLDCLTALMKRNSEQSEELLEVLARGSLVNRDGTHATTAEMEEEDDDIDVRDDDDDDETDQIRQIHRVDTRVGSPGDTAGDGSAVVVKDLRVRSFETSPDVFSVTRRGSGSNMRRRQLLANTWPSWLELAAEPFSMCDVTPENDFVLNALAANGNRSNTALVPSSRSATQNQTNVSQSQVGSLPSFSCSNSLDCENEKRPLLFEEAWMLRLLAPAFAGDGIVLAAKDAPAAILAVTLRAPPSSAGSEPEGEQEPLFFYSSSLDVREGGARLTAGEQLQMNSAPALQETEVQHATTGTIAENDPTDESPSESSPEELSKPRQRRQAGQRTWWKEGKPFVRHTLEYFDPNCGKFVSVQIPFCPPQRKALDRRLLANGASGLVKSCEGSEKTGLHQRATGRPATPTRARSSELEALLKSPPPADLFSCEDDPQVVQCDVRVAIEEGKKYNERALDDDDNVITV